MPWLGARADRLAIVALALYALLPIVRNTYVGIAGISPPVREAAIAMGLTSGQLLWHVELPLALPVMLSGIRVAMVITIGVATIAAAIGAGGLGEFIFRGIAMVDNGVILAGAIPAALMALAADLSLSGVEKLLYAAPKLARYGSPHLSLRSGSYGLQWLCLARERVERGLEELHRATHPW